jgi:exodeoxyribonuclease VII large subunit
MAHSPLTRIARDRQAAHDLGARARLAFDGHVRSLADQLAGRKLQLDALSPRATLDRGYAIVTSEGGAVVRSAADVSAGDRLAIELADATVDATTTAVHRRAPASPAAPTTQ